MKRTIAAILAGLGVFALPAPDANADTTCTLGGPVVIISLGPVTVVCGDGNVTNITHTTDVTIDPSLQIDPHLLNRAP